MRFKFLIDTYDTERIKTLTVWNSFEDSDLETRPKSDDPRGRSFREQMVHQCVSEDLWFRNFFGIDVKAPPLPEEETRSEFIKRYSEDSENRLQALRGKEEGWWEDEVSFFDVERSRAWILTRRLTHTAHHRGQLVAMLRMLGGEVYSTYGPTADTGGLMRDGAPTIYAYRDLQALLEPNSPKTRLTGPGENPPTERP